jgi:hypothetical protein
VTIADDLLLEDALASVAHLGHGGDGPWENRSHLALQWYREGRINYPVTAAWVNATYSVQLLQHDTHPGIDHLLVRRHDEGIDLPWSDLQKIKDRLGPAGQLRWAIEVYPARLALVDNHNLRHIWVMPEGWLPPVDLRGVRT